MGFDYLFAQSFPIPLHAMAALLAIPIGGAQFLLAKGTRLHRILGYVWVLLLVGVAVSGLFIHQIRWFWVFSPIHLLSVFVLVMVWRAIVAVRRGDIARHQSIMRGLYIFALLVAGAFTFLPGRVMHGVLFGVG